MNIREETLPAITALCCPIPAKDSKQNVRESGAYWYGADFSAVTKEDYARVAAEDLGEVGIWMHPKAVSGELTYDYGPVVSEAPQIPAGMERIEIPGGRFAIFTVNDAPYDPQATDWLRDAIRSCWKEIYCVWAGADGKTPDPDRFAYEYYHGNLVEIRIPIR